MYNARTGSWLCTLLASFAGRAGLSGRRRLALFGILAPLMLASFGVLAAVAPAPALAITPAQDINSSGPLSDIFVGNDLSCQVGYAGDTSYEFYGSSEVPGDCGTFVFTAGTLYAPDFANHSYTATASIGSYTPWTPVSQSSVTGSGTSSSPYTVTTIATAGASGLTLTEVDTYAVGQNTYRTDVTIANSTGLAQSGILYRAGDCFLQGSDVGFGAVTGGNSPACTVNPNNSPAGRIEQWVPITGANTYVEDGYSTVWSDIGAHADLPDTCQCTSQLDNGGGIAWDFTAPANGSVTYSHLTAFSPTGSLPLTTAKTADSSSVAAGGTDGYTITINNPNAAAVTLTDFTDSLPTGFTYVAGSTTGATSADPTISGQNLDWNGNFSLAGSSSISLHFGVTAPSSGGGPFYNNAGGTASGGYTVTPTGPTAPVTVTVALSALTTAKTADASTVAAGGTDGYTITISNPNSAATTMTSITDALATGFTYVAGSTTGATTADPTIASGTATWSGSFTVPAKASVSLHFNVTAPNSAGGPFYDNAGGTATGTSVTPTGPTAPVTVTAANTTSAHCNPGQSCQTNISTALSDLQVTALPGHEATLTESLDPGSPLECRGYTAHDPSWFGFFLTTSGRGKVLIYTLKNTLPDLTQFCFGAPYEFKTNKGVAAGRHRLPDGSNGFVGLLGFCRTVHRGPCLASRTKTADPSSSTGFDTVLGVRIPAGLPGDPWGRA